MDHIQLLELISTKQSPSPQTHQLNELIHFMLQNIGTTNAKLRDELIYSGFCELILNDVLHVEQLTYILETCIDHQHLLYHIGRFDDVDAVFTRTFSSLVIVLCLMKDQEQPYIQEDLLERVMKTSYKYFINEADFRGYVPHKGWAHSIAHGSDLFTQLIMHPQSYHYLSLQECFNVLKRWVSVSTPLIDNEHERIVQVILALLDKGLSTHDLSCWLTELQAATNPDYYTAYRMQWNVDKMIQSLYFELLSRPKHAAYTENILKTFIIKQDTEVL